MDTKLENQQQGQKKMRIFLTPSTLAARWSITTDALCQWRWNGKTPPYHKIGKKVLYDLEEIERFEARSLRQNTSQQDNKAAMDVAPMNTKQKF